MDTFIEQIVVIKKNAKTWGLFALITLAAMLLLFLIVLFLRPLLPIGFIGVCFGAYKLYSMLFIEYEYIITNGTMDIDKIVAKSYRKRMASFEISAISRLEKYNSKAKPVGDYKKTVISCNEDDTGAYFAVVDEEGKGKTLVIFSPNEKTREAMLKFLPKYISNSAFKD